MECRHWNNLKRSGRARLIEVEKNTLIAGVRTWLHPYFEGAWGRFKRRRRAKVASAHYNSSLAEVNAVLIAKPRDLIVGSRIEGPQARHENAANDAQA